MNLLHFSNVLLYGSAKKEYKMTREQLQAVLDQYGKSLSAFCYALCKNESLSDDIFQDVCVRLLKKNVALREEKAFKTYLYKTALSVYRDYLRAAEKRGEVGIDEAEQRRYVRCITNDESEQDEYEALYSAVMRLPDKFREVITLTYFREMKEEDAAKILGIPKGTVKSRLHKAKELLKKELTYENH